MTAAAARKAWRTGVAAVAVMVIVVCAGLFVQSLILHGPT